MELLFKQIDVTSYSYRGIRQWLGTEVGGCAGVLVIEWNRESAAILKEYFTIVGADGYNFIDQDSYKRLRARICEMVSVFRRDEKKGLDFLDGYVIEVCQ